jgi:SAM-dependent methyltransferase
MRDLKGLGPFDACVCLYTVLGYFDDAENERVVRAVREALRPGGALLLDLSNPLMGLRAWQARHWREHAGGVAREQSRYDAVTGRLISERTLFRKDGARVDLPTSVVRMYAPSEAARLLRDAGFEVEQLYGALADEPFRWDACDKQVWVARRL